MVRLVKGAYWDTEIKRAQMEGLDYPVFTRKAHTDVAYLVCAQKLLAERALLYPQFATHNAHTFAAIYVWARREGLVGLRDFEFQCLHGMGEALYDRVVLPAEQGGLGIPCRIYAPVGRHDSLLAYLVRRLLENGANTSFVHRIVDHEVSIDELIADPFEAARENNGAPHPDIPRPAMLYVTANENARKNSSGLDLAAEVSLRHAAEALAQAARRPVRAEAVIDARPTPATRPTRGRLSM
jgi:RHH-type proline utilization regulon transcriptional repressor/proline dehydrogenase/delta 1-pyrroline-5-carboxylate dehydrogenase